jgi:ABC-type sulfate/molybdate transport systems ATPase subunit
MVTHNPELAEKHAKTIYSVRDGKIESIGKKIKNVWKKTILS